MKATGAGAGLALVGGTDEAFAANSPKNDTCCSVSPYFEIVEGKLEEFKTVGLKLIRIAHREPGCLFYAFSFNGHLANCREGYKNAASLLAHIKDVAPLMPELMATSKITRLEVHGPAAELDKLREALAGLNPEWFALAEGGFRR